MKNLLSFFNFLIVLHLSVFRISWCHSGANPGKGPQGPDSQPLPKFRGSKIDHFRALFNFSLFLPHFTQPTISLVIHYFAVFFHRANKSDLSSKYELKVKVLVFVLVSYFKVLGLHLSLSCF